MCTVSFVYTENKSIITSNRDEHVERASNKPERFVINNKAILFPKDSQAGGTWFAVDANANVVVLLNGASGKHIRMASYRKSRGLIVLDLISAESPFEAWQSIDLNDIEPFTLVLFEQEKLFRLRWNGLNKETLPLDAKANHIFSSAMLYTVEVIEKREKAFYSFLSTHDKIDEKDMIRFHSNAEKEGNAPAFVIDRNFLKTISITQTVLAGTAILMTHKDLIHGTESSNSFTA